MTPIIALLDLDGVLIKPGGYRAVVERGMALMIERLGLQVPAPDATIPRMFEAQGVTTEWDMVPIGCAIVLNSLSEHTGQPLPALNLEGIAQWIHERNPGYFSVDYAGKVCQLASVCGSHTLPAQRLFEAIEQGRAANLFPFLDHQPFLRELLGNSRSMETSFVMRMVQNFLLGDRIYEQTYHRPAEFRATSLLEELDQPAITADTAERFEMLRGQRLIFPCCYTARPTLPPSGSLSDPLGYSPEAEISLAKVGLASIPLIGYGSLQWLGKEAGVIADSLLKPVPVQALAAVYAAWTGREVDGLRWAYRVAGKAAAGEDLHGEASELPEVMELHVFEDSASGIIAGQYAAEILRGCGLRVNVCLWGILANPYKEEALRATGAQLFPDVNMAMQAAFRGL